MPEVSFEIECEILGHSATLDTEWSDDGVTLYVTPCERCIETAKDDGKKEATDGTIS